MLHQPHKHISETKFEKLIHAIYDDRVFPEAVKKVYDVSPEGKSGAKLRQIVISTAASNASKLYEQHKTFSAVVGSNAAIGADLCLELTKLPAKVITKTRAIHLAASKELTCNRCWRHTYSNSPAARDCPLACGNSVYGSRTLQDGDSVTLRMLFQCYQGHFFEVEHTGCTQCPRCMNPTTRIASHQET